jgi:hypothetical protein
MNGAPDDIARLLAGELDEAGRRALAARLAADPAALKEFGGHALVDGLLGVALEDEVSAERRHGRLMEALRRVDQDDFLEGVKQRLQRQAWRKRVAAVAAVLAIGGLSWLMVRPDGVATVRRLETVSWSGGTSLKEGAVLRKGSRLCIEGGLVELEMGGRGRMIVEGPADLEFVSGMESRLHRGRLLMRVNEAGHGYRVETPKGSVIDLGTEFGVAVGGDDRVETHVLSGEVEAIPDGGRKVLLKKDDALLFDGGNGTRFKTDGGSFYTELPPPRSGRPDWIRWPMESAREGRDRAEVGGFGPGAYDMVFKAADEGGVPETVDGVFGSAAAFDGKGGHAESAFPGIGGQEPRTVSFWVKVPGDFSVREGFGIISWGSVGAADFGRAWQISINPLEKDGPLGRLRVGAHGGQIVGATDLRDGRWHHVAVVLYPASRPDIGKHVLIYLDGRLEPISRRALHELDTRIDGPAHGVSLGRNLSHQAGSVDHRHGGYFRGCLDEVFIVSGALGQDEVRQLMEKNGMPR